MPCVTRRLPDVFLGLLDSRLEAPAISRVLTAEHDALVVRLIELAIDEQGAPPAAFSWLALGSAARGELTLSSDQDNGLAFDDPDSGDGATTAAHPVPADPDVEAYFARLAESVNTGLVACGYEADYSGVTASNPTWRLSLSTWKRLFTECLVVPDHSHLIGASIAFDFRTVTGQLPVVPPLLEIVRTAPKYPDFLASLAQTVTDTQSPLGFRRRLTGPVDIKKSGLFPIENLARYYALGNGLTPSATLDRLTALEDLGTLDAGRLESLKAAYKAMADLRLRHHADLLRVGRRPDNAIDTTLLTRLEHAELQEALRVVDDARKLMPPRLHGWG